MAMDPENRLGEYLRNRRANLDPTALGFAQGRRRTPGLRREEVAMRANISPAWYTWLEQGRGGAPSPHVLDRLAGALMLTEIEREHLFLLGLGHPPEVRYRGGDIVTPRLQRLLDAMPASPAIVKTATWDVLAWNRAAELLLADYGKVPPGQRNVLRMLFCNPEAETAQPGWRESAQSVVAAFRIDAARAGAAAEIEPLVDELCECSPEFAELWRGDDVQSSVGIVKRLQYRENGSISLEYSCLAIDGRPDLAMAVWNPVTPQDREAVLSILRRAENRSSRKTDSPAADWGPDPRRRKRR